MMFGRIVPSLVLMAMVAVFSAPAYAGYSVAVKGACKKDYKRFCSAYGVKDPGLRKCMDRAGRSLSVRCVKALVNGGHVSRARATQRWGHKL